MKAAALLPAFLLLAGCATEPPPPAEKPVPVRVRAPQRVERTPTVQVSGTVEAETAVEAAFQVAGRVARIAADEGQFVARGQLLAALETADYANAAQAAAAQAEAARATESKAEAGLREQERELARIDYERLADEYRRMRLLYERRSLPAVDFRKIEAAYNAARERYELAREGTRREDIQAAAAATRAASAQARIAQKRVADTRLLAPVSGFVGMRRIDAGETVAPGVPVFSVLDLDPVKVRAGIPEVDIGKVRAGAAAEVRIPALANRAFSGVVELVGVAADPASRTYSVRIRVPNPQRLLRAGMVAEASIAGAGAVSVLTVPGDALVRDARGATQVFVYYPARRRVYARPVELGTPLGDELEIRGGLSGAEQIVVAGQRSLREGALVEIAGGRP